MSIINRPSANRPSLNQPVQQNTSFLQASINKVNNTVNNVLPKNIANTVNNTLQPINDSINSAVNNSENAESYTYIVVTIGFLVLLLLLFIYFQAQIIGGLKMIWEKMKGLVGKKSDEDVSTNVPFSSDNLPSASPWDKIKGLVGKKSETDMPPSMPPTNVKSYMVPEVTGLKTIENSIQSNVNKIIPKRKEVFNVAQDVYTYSDAEPLCKAYGAELATYDQVKEAWNKGADWCNYGWVKGQTAVYPTQKATYDKLQAGPEGQRGSCGVPGVNGGYFDNPELRFGVNCYGTRPDSNEADERYKAANRQNNTPEGMAYDKKVRDFKAHLNQIPIAKKA